MDEEQIIVKIKDKKGRIKQKRAEYFSPFKVSKYDIY